MPTYVAVLNGGVWTDTETQAIYTDLAALEAGKAPLGTPRTNTFTGSTSDTLTLTHTPNESYHCEIYKGGARLAPTIDFNRTGGTVTLLFPRETTDLYAVFYHS